MQSVFILLPALAFISLLIFLPDRRVLSVLILLSAVSVALMHGSWMLTPFVLFWVAWLFFEWRQSRPPLSDESFWRNNQIIWPGVVFSALWLAGWGLIFTDVRGLLPLLTADVPVLQSAGNTLMQEVRQSPWESAGGIVLFVILIAGVLRIVRAAGSKNNPMTSGSTISASTSSGGENHDR